jgi:hypothetical protein
MVDETNFANMPLGDLEALFKVAQASMQSIGFTSSNDPALFKRYQDISTELQRRNQLTADQNVVATKGATIPIQGWKSPNKPGEIPQTTSPAVTGSAIKSKLELTGKPTNPALVGRGPTTGHGIPPDSNQPPNNPTGGNWVYPTAPRRGRNPYAPPSMEAFQAGLETSLRTTLGGPDRYAIDYTQTEAGALRLSISQVGRKGAKGPALVTDLTPGYNTPFGASVNLFNPSGWHGVISPEIIVNQLGVPGGTQIRSPMEAFSQYVRATFSPEMAKYERNPSNRFTALLAKGNRIGSPGTPFGEAMQQYPIAGGMEWIGPEETEYGQAAFANRIAVSINPALKDQGAVLQNIYNQIVGGRAATKMGIATSEQMQWAKGYGYAPILDEQSRMRLALFGYEGPDETIVAPGKDAGNIIKRLRIRPVARPEADMIRLNDEGRPIKAAPLPLGVNYETGKIDTESMKAPYRAGYRILGAPPGTNQPLVGYVQPATLFREGPYSGGNFTYVDFLKKQGIIAAGAATRIEPDIPNLSMSQLANAEWEFGQYKETPGEAGAPSTFERTSNELPAGMEAHSSAILGLLKYTNAENIPQTVPLRYSTERPIFFTGKPQLSVASFWSPSTGVGLSGMHEGGKQPTDIQQNVLAGQIAQKFMQGGGGVVNTGTSGETQFQIPITTETAVSAKGIVKGPLLPITTQKKGDYDQRIRIMLDQQTEVERQIYGITNSLKLPDDRMMGHFLAATPTVREKLVSTFGETNPQLAEGLRRYLRFNQTQGTAFNYHGQALAATGLPQSEMMGQIYAKWTNQPYQWEVSANQMYGAMRQNVEALPPREQLQRFEYLGKVPERPDAPNMVNQGLMGWGDRYSWQRSIMQSLIQQQQETNQIDITTSTGRRAFRQIYGKSPTQISERFMQWEPTNLRGQVSSQFPKGEPIYNWKTGGPAAFGTMVAPLVAEHMGRNVRLNYETIAALNAVYPQTADMLGLGVKQKYIGGESPTGYTPKDIRAWREVGEVSSLLSSETNINTPPFKYTELDENVRGQILGWGGTDLGELDKLIGGEGPLYDPKSKVWLERPSTIQSISTVGFQGDMDVKTALSRWASYYPTAIKGMAQGMTPNLDQGATEGEYALGQIYQHRATTFSSKRGGVMRDIASRYLAQAEYMRYGAITGLPYGGVAVNRQTIDSTLRQLARYSPAMKEAGLGPNSKIEDPNDPNKRIRWIDLAKRQLSENNWFPGMVARSPTDIREGGALMAPVFTQEGLAKMGINYPQSTMIRGNQISPGSPLTTGTFQMGAGQSVFGGDFDFDPATIAAVMSAGPQGLNFLQGGEAGFTELTKYFAMTPKQRVREYEALQATVGGRGIIPGNEFNQTAKEATDSMKNILLERVLGRNPNAPIPGGSTGIEAGAPGTRSRYQAAVPYSDLWNEASTVLKSGVKGSWQAYLPAELFESTAAGLGWSDKETNKAKSELGYFYRGYLESSTGKWKQRGGPNAIESMLQTSIFGVTPSGEYRLTGKERASAGWSNFWYGGKSSKGWGEAGQSLLRNSIGRRMTGAIAEDIASMSTPSYHLASYLTASREEDVPALQTKMETLAQQPGMNPQRAIQTALWGPGNDIVGPEAYYKNNDPTMSIGVTSLTLSMLGKSMGWLGHGARTWTNPETGVTSLSMQQIQNEPIWFHGKVQSVQGLWQSPPMQTSQILYSMLRNQPSRLGENYQRISANFSPEQIAGVENFRTGLEGQGKEPSGLLNYFSSQFSGTPWAANEDIVKGQLEADPLLNIIQGQLEADRLLNIIQGKRVSTREQQENLDAYIAGHPTLHTEDIAMPANQASREILANTEIPLKNLTSIRRQRRREETILKKQASAAPIVEPEPYKPSPTILQMEQETKGIREAWSVAPENSQQRADLLEEYKIKSRATVEARRVEYTASAQGKSDIEIANRVQAIRTARIDAGQTIPEDLSSISMQMTGAKIDARPLTTEQKTKARETIAKYGNVQGQPPVSGVGATIATAPPQTPTPPVDQLPTAPLQEPPQGGADVFPMMRQNKKGEWVQTGKGISNLSTASNLLSARGGSGLGGRDFENMSVEELAAMRPGSQATVNVIHQWANTSPPDMFSQRQVIQKGMTALAGWVTNPAAMDLDKNLRQELSALTGATAEQASAKDIPQLWEEGFNANRGKATDIWRKYQGLIQTGSKVSSSVMAALNANIKVRTNDPNINQVIAATGLNPADPFVEQKFGAVRSGNAPAEGMELYNQAAGPLNTATILNKIGQVYGLSKEKMSAVSAEDMEKFNKGLREASRLMEVYQKVQNDATKSVEAHTYAYEKEKEVLLKQKILPTATMALAEARADVRAAEAEGSGKTPSEIYAAQRKLTAAEKAYGTARKAVQRLEAGEVTAEGAVSEAEGEGGRGITTEGVGKMSRRLLGGFGLMYLKSIAGIIMQPTQMGYAEQLQEQQAVQQGYGKRFGGVVPFANPEQQYQRAAATYGGIGWSQIRQTQAQIMREQPSVQGAIGMGEAGIGTGGLVATLGWMAGTPVSWPALAAVAVTAGVVSAGINIYGAKNQPEKNAITLASQEASGANPTPGYWDFKQIFNWSNYGFMQDKERQTPMVDMLRKMRQYQEGGGADLRGFLAQEGVEGNIDTNKYMAMYQQVQASQYPNIPMEGLVGAQGLQDQYKMMLTEGDYGSRAILATGIAQGIPYEQTAMLAAYSPSRTFEQQQQAVGQTIQNWLTQAQGLTQSEITKTEIGAKRFQQLGLFAPRFPEPTPERTYTVPSYGKSREDVIREQATRQQPLSNAAYNQAEALRLGAGPQTFGQVMSNEYPNKYMPGYGTATAPAPTAIEIAQFKANAQEWQAAQPSWQGVPFINKTEVRIPARDLQKEYQDILANLPEYQNTLIQADWARYTSRKVMGLPEVSPAATTEELTQKYGGTLTEEEIATRMREDQRQALRTQAQEQVWGGWQALGVTNPNMMPTETATYGQLQQQTAQLQFGNAFSQTMMSGGMEATLAQGFGGAFGLMAPQQFEQYKALANLSPQQWGAYLLKNPQIAAQLPGMVGGIGGQVSTQSIGMVDVNAQGGLTGMGWGTSTLATPQMVGQIQAGGIMTPMGIQSISPQMATTMASQQMANKIWGQGYQGRTDISQGAAAAMVSGGTFGLAQYQQTLNVDYQKQMAGNQLAMLNLQGEYMPKFWNIEDRQRSLQNQQAQWGFQMQERQMGMQRGQFYENIGLNQQQAQMQRGWTQQDWQYQNQTRNLQWGWKQEDFGEQLRFMTGRDRRLAERQMGRETTLHDLESEQITKTRDRQKELWALEDQRFALQKKQFEEQMALQQENLNKQKEFYTQGRALQEEQVKLQREYWKAQHELQLAAGGAAAKYATEQGKVNQLMLEFSQFSTLASAKGNLFNSETIKALITAIAELDPVFAHLLEQALNLQQYTGGGGCFVAGTSVSTWAGVKDIADIKEGDIVMSYDEESGCNVPNRVTRIFQHPQMSVVEVKTEHGVVKCTPKHTFWTGDKGWKSACNLEEGETIKLIDGHYTQVICVTDVIGSYWVYNLSIEHDHTYYVEEMLVHNTAAKNAIGGPTIPGQYHIVGENGPELINTPYSVSVMPNNELKARMYNSEYNSSWASTTINNQQAKEPFVQRLTIPIYIGNEYIEDMIVEIVDGEVRKI